MRNDLIGPRHIWNTRGLQLGAQQVEGKHVGDEEVYCVPKPNTPSLCNAKDKLAIANQLKIPRTTTYAGTPGVLNLLFNE